MRMPAADDDLTRNGPVSDEAEKYVLAAVLEDARCFDKVAPLKAMDFAFQAHRAIFSAVESLWESGRGGGILAIEAHLTKTGELAQAQAPGGIAYLRELMDHSVMGRRFLEDYVGTVREYAMRRALVAEAREMAERANNVGVEESAAEIAGDALSRLAAFQADAGSRRTDARTVREAEVAALAQPIRAHRTGFMRLDRAMGGGLVAGRAYGIAGRFKTGKSALAGTISRNLNRAGIRHLYVACEMGSAELERRSLAVDLGINSLAFIDPATRDDPEFRRRAAQAAIATPRNAIYLDAPALTFDRLRREVESAVAGNSVSGVILDYLQLIAGRARGVTQAEHLDDVTLWLANTCRRRQIWALVLAQVNQEGGTRGGEAPLLAFDQVFRLEREDEGGPGAWLTMLSTRFTKWGCVGTKEAPALRLNESIGPYFEEILDERA